MCRPSVGCGTAIRVQSATQSATPNITAVYMMLPIRVYDNAGNVIETHEHTGDFQNHEFLLASGYTPH
jgi:hypothetical protein